MRPWKKYYGLEKKHFPILLLVNNLFNWNELYWSDYINISYLDYFVKLLDFFPVEGMFRILMFFCFLMLSFLYLLYSKSYKLDIMYIMIQIDEIDWVVEYNA